MPGASWMQGELPPPHWAKMWQKARLTRAPEQIGRTAQEISGMSHHFPNVCVVCGSGPGRTRPHNRRCLWHHGKEQPQLGQTAAVESNSSICFKRLLHSCLKQGSSRQTQGVVVAALSRWLELRVRCAASALRSSTEAASSVLSTSSKSWIACVGRANSST